MTQTTPYEYNNATTSDFTYTWKEITMEGTNSTEAGFYDLRILVWIDNDNVTSDGANTTRTMNYTVTAIDVSLSELASQTYTITEAEIEILYEGTNITAPDFFVFEPTYSLRFDNGSEYPDWITTFAPDYENEALPVDLVLYSENTDDAGRFKLNLVLTSGFSKFLEGQDQFYEGIVDLVVIMVDSDYTPPNAAPVFQPALEAS